jgi:hypothetical protein
MDKAKEETTLNRMTVARKIAGSDLPVKQQEMLFKLLKLPSANQKGGKVKGKKMMYGSKVKKKK